MSTKKKEPTKKCVVKTCTNRPTAGTFVGQFCFPCWDAITNPGPATRHSAIYRQMFQLLRRRKNTKEQQDQFWNRLRKEVEDYWPQTLEGTDD